MPHARPIPTPSGRGRSLLIAVLSLPLGVGVAAPAPTGVAHAPAQPALAAAPSPDALLAMLPSPPPRPPAPTRAPLPPVAPVPARPRAAVSRALRPPPADVWLRLADCESGYRDRHGRVLLGSARWGLDSGNGYYGGLQFSVSSWRWVGGTGLPHEHAPEEQIRRGALLQRRIGWARAWPLCARRLGLA